MKEDMKKLSFPLEDLSVTVFSAAAPRILFLQPVDEHDEALLEREMEEMRDCALPFALAAFQVADWNRDLSPWPAPPVFGKAPFGGGAEQTLRFVTDGLLPVLRDRLALSGDVSLCLGGYSLAGLFALWAAARTDIFDGVAAASPSVWFPGWLDYVKEHPIRAEKVYLSLGDREERAKNPILATVGDCIRQQYALLQAGHSAVLEWNPGNHFQNSETRTAKAFLWLARP